MKLNFFGEVEGYQVVRKLSPFTRGNLKLVDLFRLGRQRDFLDNKKFLSKSLSKNWTNQVFFGTESVQQCLSFWKQEKFGL